MVECRYRLFNPLDPFIVARCLLIETGMFREVMLYLAFDLVALFFKLLKRAGPFLGGVRGHLAPIDGKQLVAQQPLLVANQ